MPEYIVHKAIELDAISTKVRKKLNVIQSWIVSPKYDGCHAIFCFDKGKHVGTYSRTGEVVRSLDHIAADLISLYHIGQGRVAICGEAWMEGTAFNEISGAFRRHAPQPQMQFVPFDIVPFDYEDCRTTGPAIVLGQRAGVAYDTPYIERMRRLFHGGYGLTVLNPVYTTLWGDLDHAVAQATERAKLLKGHETDHFDGAVLARSDGLYHVGAGKGGEFIKIKPLISHSVKVTAVIADTGAKTGKSTCVLAFDLAGFIQLVSTGLTQAQVDAFVADPSLIIDKTIEVEAMGITVNGLLREPRFKGIRDDA